MEASENEKAYNWLRAANSYEEALTVISQKESSRRGDIEERKGYALYKAAMQSESVESFRRRMSLAIEEYERARASCEESHETGAKARWFRCESMIAFLASWLAKAPQEKKRVVEQAWARTQDALRAFEELKDYAEYGKTYNQLSAIAEFALAFQGHFRDRERILREAIESGERAVKFLSVVGEQNQLARAYVIAASYIRRFISYLPDLDDREKFQHQYYEYWHQARGLSEENALVELVSCALGPYVLDQGTDETLTMLQRSLKYVRERSDRFMIGTALSWLVYHSFWKLQRIEGSDARLLLEQILQYTNEAREAFARVSHVGVLHIFWVGEPYSDYYLSRALLETDSRKRRELLDRALEASAERLKRALDSGYPDVVQETHHVLSKILVALATLEWRREERVRLLEEALEHRNESIRLLEEAGPPYQLWNRGAMRSYLAEIKSQLANLAKDSETKMVLLNEALQAREVGIEHGIKGGEGNISINAVLADWHYEYGDLLESQYGVVKEKEYLKRAGRAFENAAQYFQTASLTSRVAECYWKAAEVYDSLDQHLKAADSFTLASDNYGAAAKSLPQLQVFYEDLVGYMKAWSHIEKARHHHGKEEYVSARESYETAARILALTKGWNHLSVNYQAWACLEEAEDLSIKDKEEEAVQTFHKASQLFLQVNAAFRTRLSNTADPDERRIARNFIKGTALRQDYCKARIPLEEAKTLERKGQLSYSAEKYGEAARAFERIIKVLELERDRREVEFIMTLSKAWQKTMLAEAGVTRELYLEASDLFKHAAEIGSNERTTTLALGHSHFCMALESASRFVNGGDVASHAEAVQHFETASDHYLKAGNSVFSEQAKANRLLLDAYTYMNEARLDRVEEQRAKLLMKAERVLEASATAYAKAGRTAKRDEISRLIENVREEEELVISLRRLLKHPLITSDKIAIPASPPASETAVGLQRFEHSDVQGNLTADPSSLEIGEKLELRIELVNAGRGLAQLIKMDNAVPPGFEMLEGPQKFTVQGSSLDLKGHVLYPLKTEEVKLTIKPKVEGHVTVSPKIRYLDESGRYKSYGPEAIDLVVKGAAVPVWLRETAMVPSESGLRFGTERAREIFRHLVKAFSEDYFSRGLNVEKAGWRSLMRLVRESGLPRSALYGRSGGRSRALGELEGLGLVEIRVFTDEPGRGGTITKVRLAYRNAILRNYLGTDL